MAFSQQYSGKVLVPWYNNFEWQQVCSYLRTNDPENLLKVLHVLKIWKTRTPLLSAGVEGTLIILNTLFQENTCTKDQLVQIYAVSLLRFFNLCATNSDRQGTFQRTAQKNALPKWLIDIRHDIAHGHKLPSKFILELALKQSLQWLIEKYWNTQDQVLNYIITDQPNDELVNLLTIYINYIISTFNNSNSQYLDYQCIENINEIIRKSKLKNIHNSCDIIPTAEELIKRFLETLDEKNVSSVIDIIVSENALLNFTVNYDIENDINSVPKSFRNIWTNLLNIIANNRLLNPLLNELFEVTCNDVFSTSIRLKASLWIHEIFHGLDKVKAFENMKNNIEHTKDVERVTITSFENKNSTLRDAINFLGSNFLVELHSDEFEEKILNFPNVYTLNYLESVLKYNKNSFEFISDLKKLINNLIFTESNDKWEHSKIFTVNDLPFLKLIDDSNDSRNETTLQKSSNNRWNEIKDKVEFRKCPLGVLPEQGREVNPLIDF